MEPMTTRRQVLAEVRGLVMVNESFMAGLDNEIQFWSLQLQEHALLLSMMLIPELADRAATIDQKWLSFRRKLGGKDSHLALREVFALCDELRAFKSELIDLMTRGTWVGWVTPGMVDHLRDELDFFVCLVSGDTSDRGAAEKWLEFAAEHASQVAGMLDPIHHGLVQESWDKANALSKLQQNAGEAITLDLLEDALETQSAFDQWIRTTGIGTPKTRSMAPMIYVNHVLREGKRFQQTFLSMREGLGPPSSGPVGR